MEETHTYAHYGEQEEEEKESFFNVKDIILWL